MTAAQGMWVLAWQVQREVLQCQGSCHLACCGTPDGASCPNPGWVVTGPSHRPSHRIRVRLAARPPTHFPLQHPVDARVVGVVVVLAAGVGHVSRGVAARYR